MQKKYYGYIFIVFVLGHFSNDCFYQPGATSYSLVPDIDNLTEDIALETHKVSKQKKKVN